MLQNIWMYTDKLTIKIFTTISGPLQQCYPVELSAVVAEISLCN